VELGNGEVAPAANNLVLYHLSETNGNAVDSSGNNRNATNNGANQNVSGFFGNGIQFDGSNDSLDIAADLGDPTEMTIEFWLNAPNMNHREYLLDGRNNGNWWFLKDYRTGAKCSDTNGNVCFNGLVQIPAVSLSNNIWQHIAVTANTTETKIYLNGNLMDTGAAFNPDLGANVHVGTRFTNSGFLNGTMDDIAIWDTTLDQATIQGHASKYKSPGTYTSKIFDATQNASWDDLSWNETIVNSDVTFQVRSCDDALCDTEIFVGPDGTAGTSFTTNAGEAINVPMNRYFQYRASFSNSNTNFTSEVSSVTVDASYYSSGLPTIKPNSSLVPNVLTSWSGFRETVTKPAGSEVYYQLSDDDGTTWRYWDGGAWVVAGASDYSLASVVNANISSFPIASGKIMFRAFLSSNGVVHPKLSKVEIEFNGNPATSNCVKDWDFTNAGDYSYDHALIDVAGNKSSLLNHSYSVADDSKVEFDNGVYASTQWNTDHVELSPGASPYVGAGTYSSKIFDAGDVVTWQNLSWSEVLSAPSNWFNSAWNKRKSITVDNTATANVLIDYQVKLKINYDADMKADFSDLRFTSSDGTTEIDYWIHEYVASTSAVVWVKVPSIPASSTTNIFMYYGNNAAVTTSNGGNTFLVFDDFNDGSIDSAKWLEVDPNNEIDEVGGTLNFTRLSNGNWNRGIVGKDIMARGDLSFDFDYKWKANNPSYDAIMFGWHDNGTSPVYSNMPYAFYNPGSGGGTTINKYVYEDGNSRSGVTSSWVLGQDYDVRIRMRNAGGAYYDYSTDGGNTWSTAYTSVYSNESNLKLGWSFYSGTHEFDNARVRKWTATEPSSSFANEEDRQPTDLTFQVRSCNDSLCDTETFVGPDGTAGTTFTTAAGENISVSGNRYFQYRVSFVSSDSNYSPELSDVAVTTSGYYSSSKPDISPTASYSGLPIVKWTTFEETAIKPVNTEAYYQLSDDDAVSWKWWDGSAWADVSDGVLADANTVGLWHLNNSSSSVVDSSSFSNNGTNYGATRGVAGQFGKAFSFDGVDDYVEIPHKASLNLANTDFSIEFYLKTADADGLILKKYTGTFGHDGWAVRLNAGVLEFYDGANWISSGVSVNDNSWKYIAITADDTSNTVKFYVNENLVKSSPFTDITTNVFPLEIGKEVNSKFFAGLIDDLRISNKLRTSQEMKDFRWCQER